MLDERGGQPDVVGVPAADRVLHSDPHDFAGLYIRHRASFTLHARRYLKDARDADEVVQEAFLRLFLALPELETELQALAYCRRTITNLCIDRYRAQARRPSLVDLDSAGDLAEEDPGDPVVRAEDASIVRQALSLLSPLHRAALVKREIEEKPLPVIAEELEIPEESVKHVLFRARRALRRILATTSLAPGSDAEIAGALGKAARAGSSGVAAFLLLLFVGLGTGPDLRSIPVVGTDLPAITPVEHLAAAVGTVVTNVASAVADAGSTDEPVASGPSDAEAGEPLPAPDPTRSSTSATQEVAASPTTETATADAEPSGASTAPEPSVAPAPTAPESAGASSSASPSTSPSPSASSSPSATPTSPSASPSPSPTTSSSSSPSPDRSSGPDRRVESRPSESPSPSPAVDAG